jgi:hypothetical protein
MTVNLGLLLASSALSLFLLEAGFRLYERSFLIHQVDPEASVYDLELYEYNDHEGFLARQRAPGEFRILSFGDSFAASVTRAPYTYASVIQRQLSPMRASGRVRVVNFGRRGTSFPDYISQLRIWSQNVEFDAVLLNLYAGNDFAESTDMLFVAAVNHGYRSGKSHDALSYGPGVYIPRRFPLRFIDYVYAHYYGRVYASSPPTGANATRELYRSRAPQFPRDVYLDLLKHTVGVYRPDRIEAYFHGHYWLFKLLEAARKLEESGTPVVITMAPSHLVVDDGWMRAVLARAAVRPDQLAPGLPGAVVQDIARAAGFDGPILDLTACLRAANARGEQVYWGTNTHWSVHGNERVGELLADELSRLWFDEIPGAGEDPDESAAAALGCDLAPAPLPAPAAVSLDETVNAVRALLRFERTALAELIGQTFETPAALAHALERSGYTPSPNRIRGAYWGFSEQEGPGWSRPHGLRHFVRPQGWAIDEDAPGQSILVGFFHAGRIIGVGQTVARPGVHLVETQGVPGGSPNVVFRSLVPKFGAPGDLRAVAISPSGHFAALPYEPRESRLK